MFFRPSKNETTRENIQALTPSGQTIHAVGVLEGIGDIQNLLNWYAVYHQEVLDNQDKVIFCFANKKGPQKLASVLHHLAKIKPTHPIFEIITVELDPKLKKPRLKIKEPLRVALTKIPARDAKTHRQQIDRSIFPDLTKDTLINLVAVSVGDFAIDGAKTQFIHEFNGFRDGDSSSKLGVGRYNLGILRDPDAPTGHEDFANIFKELSPANKELIFGSSTISEPEAQHYLQSGISVYGYLQRESSSHTLHSVLMSPLIQQEIEGGKVPLFFLTGNKRLRDLPKSIRRAVRDKKIRLVMPGFMDDARQFEAINALFLNKDVKSLVIASGDNSLSQALMCNKFPIYAFVKGLPIPSMKSWIFTAMATNIYNNPEKFPQEPGQNECIATLDLFGKTKERVFFPGLRDLGRALKMRLHQSLGFRPGGDFADYVDNLIRNSIKFSKNPHADKLKYYESKTARLTPEAFDYYTKYVGPFIQENCQFKAEEILQKITKPKPSHHLSQH